MQFFTARVTLLLTLFASLWIEITAINSCSKINNKDVDLTKLQSVPTGALQRDEFFNELGFSYIIGVFSGDFTFQVVEYPYGGGPIITLRNRYADVTKKVAIAVSVGDGTDYYWLPMGTTCRHASPRNAKSQDIKDIKIYHE